MNLISFASHLGFKSFTGYHEKSSIDIYIYTDIF